MYAWFDAGGGRKVYRRVPERKQARSDLPCPSLIRDFAEPVQSMADGKWYSSKRDLSRSARAAHNPHGQDFIELGTEEMPFVEHKTSERELRDDIRGAMSAVENGWRPEVVALED
jgi:hypothetical protein